MVNLKQVKLAFDDLKLPELPFNQIPLETRRQIPIWVVRAILFHHHKKSSLNLIELDLEIVKLKDLTLANLKHLGYGDNLIKNQAFLDSLIIYIEELLHYTNCLLEQGFNDKEYLELDHGTVLFDVTYTLLERWFWICSASKSKIDSKGVITLQLGLSRSDKEKLIESFREPTLFEKLKQWVKTDKRRFSPKSW